MVFRQDVYVSGGQVDNPFDILYSKFVEHAILSLNIPSGQLMIEPASFSGSFLPLHCRRLSDRLYITTR